MVITYSRVWINRVRLQILLVAGETGKMEISLSSYAPENLVSRDGFGSLVPRQPAHLYVVVVVVVFFTLTDRASTIPNNTRGCQSGTWSAGQKKIRGTSTKLQ